MLESYIRTGDGTDYVEVDNVREALGIKEDEYIFRAIEKLREERDNLKDNLRITENALKTVKKERDELKEKCDKLKTRTNAVYGVSCGYSGNKAPAFLCNVISYRWELNSIEARSLMDEPSYRVNNDTIRVELELTPTANYKGTFDMEDLKKYIQAYGREKKLGIIESVDYQNAKVARAELAHLYKTVLGKERLDTNLSPHEIMKAIHDEYKRVKDSRFAFSQSLQSVYMHIYEGTGYNVSDIYAAPDKIADWIITRYDSTKTLGHMETLCDINDFIDELCGKYNVVQPLSSQTTKERLDYIFSALAENRERYNSEWKWVEQLKKEKRAVEDSLAELRAKIREIHRSVVDDEWNNLSYTSALNDINEEYKRVVHNFEERTEDWSKAQQELDRYARLRSNICTALCLGGETSDADILERIRKTRECHDKLCKDYTELHDDYVASQKQVKGFTNRCDSLENLRQDLWEFRKNAIEDLKNRGFFFRPEENETLPEIYTKLLKRYDDYFSRYKEQYRLRQQWHAGYESEHERANGVQKALDREREKCRVKDISLETAKKQYEKVCSNLETAECALNGMKNKVRSLQEEKTKVISALGQDIWDDAVK